MVTLALVFPEVDGAPRSAWLFVLVGEGPLRVLPEGRARSLVKVYRASALIVLAGVVVAFTVQQIRGGLYPALEVRSDNDHFGFGALERMGDRAAPAMVEMALPTDYRALEQDNYLEEEAPMGYAQAEDGLATDDKSENGLYAMKGPKSDEDWGRAEPQQQQQEIGGMGKSSSSSSRQTMMRKQQKLREYDANTVVQTGSGVPSWGWRSVALRWNGSFVTRDQQVQLYLLPPQLNLALAFIRVLFLMTLVFGVFGVLGRRRRNPPVGAARAGAAGRCCSRSARAWRPRRPRARRSCPAASCSTRCARCPTEPPRCSPSCATSSRMRIEAAEKGLRLAQELHVSAPVGVPLPGNAEQWLPSSVLVDGLPPVGGLVRASDGTLAIELAPGRHELVLEGPLPARETVQLALPLKPHRVEAQASGWTVDGIHEDGLADDNLQLTRLSLQDASAAPLEPEVGTLPPFVRLERSPQLGLQPKFDDPRGPPEPARRGGGARCAAAARRVGDERRAAGRGRQGAGQHGAGAGGAHVDQRAADHRAGAAERGPGRAVGLEQWRVEVGPVVGRRAPWAADGASVGEAGLREWRPWPGEQVLLTVTRPQGVPGQTLTIDSAALRLQPGVRAVDAHLALALRSSRGGHHVVQILVDALLQEVTINGVRQTIGQEGRTVRLPVEPGSQTIDLSWREPHDLWQRYAAPVVDLGGPAVNASVTVDFPQSRWILLLGGPRLGPAVLFWSFVLMLLDRLPRR